MSAGEPSYVVVGRITGPFGVRGWVRVNSYTEPRDNLLRYGPWRLTQGSQVSLRRVLEGHAQGEAIVARLEGCDDREAAQALKGAEVAVDRGAFAAPGPAEFFWADLQGMQVRTADGVDLGRVDHLFETGANDVMVVMGDRRRLIPFVYGGVVQAVDMERRLITVEWDPGF